MKQNRWTKRNRRIKTGYVQKTGQVDKMKTGHVHKTGQVDEIEQVD